VRSLLQSETGSKQAVRTLPTCAWTGAGALGRSSVTRGPEMRRRARAGSARSQSLRRRRRRRERPGGEWLCAQQKLCGERPCATPVVRAKPRSFLSMGVYRMGGSGGGAWSKTRGEGWRAKSGCRQGPPTLLAQAAWELSPHSYTCPATPARSRLRGARIRAHRGFTRRLAGCAEKESKSEPGLKKRHMTQVSL
jgi:hypothetical protein